MLSASGWSASVMSPSGRSTVVGPLPPAIQIITTFSAGIHTSVAVGSPQAERVQAMLDYMRSPQAAEAKKRQGMAPA